MGLGRRKGASSPEVRQWLGNLMVAWTFVTGLAASIAAAWYGRTGDMKVLISFLGAPFVIGAVLFLALGAYAMATRTRLREVVEPSGTRGRRRASIFAREGPEASGSVRVDGADASTWEHVSIRGRADESELREFHTLRLERQHVIAATLALTVAGGIGWAELIVPEALDVDPYHVAPAAILFAWAILLAALLSRPARLARRTLKRETLLETTFRVGPEGVEVADARGRGRFAWDSIERVNEAERIFLVRTQEGNEIVIPKRGAGPETLGRMRAVMRFHAGDRVALRA